MPGETIKPLPGLGQCSRFIVGLVGSSYVVDQRLRGCRQQVPLQFVIQFLA